MGKAHFPYGENGEWLKEDGNEYFASLLKSHAPHYLHRWNWIVMPAFYHAEEGRKKLIELKNEKDDLLGKVSRNEALADANSEKIPTEPKGVWYEEFLTIGLSLMLFLGLAQFFELEVSQIDSISDINVGHIMTSSGAVCINLGEKLSITRQARFQAEQRLSILELIDKVEEVEGTIKELNAFWRRLRRGDPSFWLAWIIVMFETAFATPGLLSVLPPTVSNSPYAFFVFVAAGLAALVNVTLSWGLALEQVIWEKRYLAIKQDIDRENIEFKAESEYAKARLKELSEEIKQAREEYQELKRSAEEVYDKWEQGIQGFIDIESMQPTEFFKKNNSS